MSQTRVWLASSNYEYSHKLLDKQPKMRDRIKAVFFDIVGTLVSFKTHRAPDSAVQAIKRLRERGIKVFIATGR